MLQTSKMCSVTPASMPRVMGCIVISDEIWVCHFNQVLSGISVVETYHKLQEESIQYLAVFGEGGIGSILGGTKHCPLQVPGRW
jgi:hypothetical protein